jgi:hypothetical protein
MVLIGGHHRMKAVRNICKIKGVTNAKMFGHVYDGTVAGTLEYLKKECLNTFHVSGIPDFFHVVFKNVLGIERIRFVECVCSDFQFINVIGTFLLKMKSQKKSGLLWDKVTLTGMQDHDAEK